MPSILIIESDEPTLTLFCEHFTHKGFEAYGTSSMFNALNIARYTPVDAVLLDLRGSPSELADFTSSLRSLPTNPALLVISGRGTELLRIRALDDGADDYLNKPVSFGELLARINAILRRRLESTVLTAGDITINAANRTVTVADRTVPLTQKEYELVTTLAQNPTRVFSKEELLHEIWGYKPLNTSRTLDTHASRLRRKLDPDQGKYVVNCWGVGYRLLGP